MKKLLTLVITLLSAPLTYSMEPVMSSENNGQANKQTVQAELGRITKITGTITDFIQYSLIYNDQDEKDYFETIVHFHPNTNGYCELTSFLEENLNKRIAIKIPTDASTKARFHFIESLFNNALQSQNNKE